MAEKGKKKYVAVFSVCFTVEASSEEEANDVAHAMYGEEGAPLVSLFPEDEVNSPSPNMGRPCRVVLRTASGLLFKSKDELPISIDGLLMNVQEKTGSPVRSIRIMEPEKGRKNGHDQ